MQHNPTSVFQQLIDLRSGSSNTGFVGPAAPERGGRVYGGQLLAQAVVAGYRVVNGDRRIHSLHGYFLRPGDVDEETIWDVEVVKDGRSFTTCAITGRQDHGEVFRMTASFHVPEPGLDYGGEAPEYGLDTVPAPEDVALTYVEFCRRHPDLDAADWYGQDRPMDIQYINPPDAEEGVSVVDPQLTWTRINEELDVDDHVARDAGLAYLADATLVDHTLLPHGQRWHDGRLTGASLDHAMWFHRSGRVDDWLLYDQRVETTGGARGLATGRFYDPGGRLLATCAQEGLIRWAGAAI